MLKRILYLFLMISAVSCKETEVTPKKTVNFILSEHLTLGNPINAAAGLNMLISD